MNIILAGEKFLQVISDPIILRKVWWT
jgi:hypothetical protein